MKLPEINGIYKLTNLINNKIYIGKAKNLRERVGRHKESEKINYKLKVQPITSAIKKYGWTSFKVDIIESFQEIHPEKLLDREEYWIKYFDATNKLIGYNILLRSNDWTGMKHSVETKKKLSEIRKKNNNWTEEGKKKMSLLYKGKKRSQEIIDNIKKGIKEKGAHDKEKKSFVVVSPSGEMLEGFGIRQFCKDFNVKSRSAFTRMLNGAIPSAGGWRIYDGTNAYPVEVKKGIAFDRAAKGEKIRQKKLGVKRKK